MALNTRSKMIAGAMDLIRRRGLNATSVREVVRYTETPRGSIKHHFPNGKLQLVTEAIELAGTEVSLPLKKVMEKHNSIDGLKIFIGWWRDILQKSDFEAGCPILAVASEQYLGEDGNPNGEAEAQLLQLVNSIFKEWQQILENALCRDGITLPRATQLATLIISSIEGTVAMCRAARNTTSLDQVEQEILSILKLIL
ncbi:TetR/AcrR family transcriptional regulator [Acinetobacter soli]|uniref:TetR/AcrR family transcriptional regulator n=1 Tax=Acinetobacter soli TaxID=487316 RepID=UPI001C0D5E64|nr:helix-turn-helix domain-containing protein [Acinetobacter soli]MBU3121748.1 TetR/AcrR family transcriptional regulator [Acinetobacter soli]